jgi:hypothetical protein
VVILGNIGDVGDAECASRFRQAWFSLVEDGKDRRVAQGKEKDRMSRPAIIPQSDFQALVVEQALAYAQQLEQAAGTAPSGQILDSCECVVLGKGRQFLRDTLAGALQQQIRQGEKKGARHAPVLADRPAATKAATSAGS